MNNDFSSIYGWCRLLHAKLFIWLNLRFLLFYLHDTEFSAFRNWNLDSLWPHISPPQNVQLIANSTLSRYPVIFFIISVRCFNPHRRHARFSSLLKSTTERYDWGTTTRQRKIFSGAFARTTTFRFQFLFKGLQLLHEAWIRINKPPLRPSMINSVRQREIILPH